MLSPAGYAVTFIFDRSLGKVEANFARIPSGSQAAPAQRDCRRIVRERWTTARFCLKVVAMTLTKRDLVIRISEETGLIQTRVFDVVQKTLDYITESLAKGDKVELRNFGMFDVVTRKARVGRNPNHPETDVPIPARAMVKFKAGKEMRAEVLKLIPTPAKK